jgi:hypothetical protein
MDLGQGMPDGAQFYFIVVPSQVTDPIGSGNGNDSQASQAPGKNAEDCSQVTFSVGLY